MVKTPEELIQEITGNKKPYRVWKLTYQTTSEILEPVYFWILDFMNKAFGGKVRKLVDNFISTTGSTRFSELTGKASSMQKQAMEIYGMVNTVIKSILNLVYDLKEFKLRLKNYDDAKNTKDSKKKQAGFLSLKQIWMDQVDIKKGGGSINSMSQQLNFVTLRDAFMASDSLEQAKELDLNERVKRILFARIEEFLEWKERSETELRKRYEIEKTYLKTQIATVKMYSRWARPYLLAVEQLKMQEPDRYNTDLVNVFNTITLQLTLMGKNSVNVEDAVLEHKLPNRFKNVKFDRNYNSIVLVDFKFRGIPQGAGFGGRVDVTFSAYTMNDEEYDLFFYKFEKSDFTDALGLVEGMTKDSLDKLKEDVNEFLEETPKKEDEEEKPEDTNPFSALFSFVKVFKKARRSIGSSSDKSDKEKKEAYLKELEKKGIHEDSYAEAIVRALAKLNAEETCYKIYDIYKKSHGMPSTPGNA